MVKLSQETYNKIIELYQQKKMIKTEIAKMCNCSTDTVYRVL